MRYKHLKRGTVYRVLSETVVVPQDCQEEGKVIEINDLVRPPFTATVQRSSNHGNPFVLYQGEDMKYWLRPRSEFFDGRFQNIP